MEPSVSWRKKRLNACSLMCLKSSVVFVFVFLVVVVCFCSFKKERVFLGLQFEVPSIMAKTPGKELKAAGHTASGVRKQNKSLGTISTQNDRTFGTISK